MADFYPVLARAVLRLPHNNAEARQELYARARSIVAAQAQGEAARAQQRALDAAIARVEAEVRTKATAESLERILQALQVDESRARLPAAARPIIKAPPASPISAVDAGQPDGTSTDLGRMPNSLGTMLFGIAYAAAAIAFTGVTYIRATVWVAQGVIGYPVLAVIMVATIGLFLIPPAIVRRTANSVTKGRVSRLIYSTSRRTP